MENKNVGWLIVGISIFIFVIIAIFYFGVDNIINATCTHGPSCSMHDTLNIQTWISIAIAFVILVIGLFLIFAKTPERIIVKTKKIKDEFAEKQREQKEKNLKLLDKEEKTIYNLLMKEGSAFQSDIVDKTQINKVKVTRILDRLEGKGLIERKRRGMTNIVVIK